MTVALLARDPAQGDSAVLEPSAVRMMLLIEYDGTRYAGSQVQDNASTIQSELERALRALTCETVRVSFAGRTDAGVHAHGQVVSFTTAAVLDAKAFINGLNHYLPEDIAVRFAGSVASDFDPRRHAVRREYEYFILNSDSRSALWRNRAYQVPGKLDIAAMNQAASLLVGEHDFILFASGVDDPQMSTVRRMYEAAVRREADMVIVRLVANAFLPHQVRNTVGTLLRVGRGKMTPAAFQGIINVREFGLAGPCVPACGLYLKKVYYANNL
ncbi:MAG: tRNA pseudouridine(38-40) synthase TruA [Dehalococcoidia bacterium]|nr:tRNA pseudouridine(38-40) synthase TruA [Dehalococcoidia bacterium]